MADHLAHREGLWSTRGARLLLVVAAGLVAIAAACTAFDDVPPPSSGTALADAGLDGDVDGGGGEAGATGVVPIDVAAKICARVAQCPSLGSSIAASLRFPVLEASYSVCLTELGTDVEPTRTGRETTARVLADLAAAPTCSAAAALLTIELTRPGDPRCLGYDGGTYDACLDEKTAIHCFAPGSYAQLRHCGKPSRTGDERCYAFDGGAECALAASCAGATCIGAVLDVCRPGPDLPLYHAQTDCTLLGMQCAVTKKGNIGCSETDQVIHEVAGMVGASCDGGARVSMADIFFGTTDCTKRGGQCTRSGLAALCTYPTDECSPFSTTDTCMGTVFQGCIGGKKATFDCASIGKACTTDLSPVGYRARCE